MAQNKNNGKKNGGAKSGSSAKKTTDSGTSRRESVRGGTQRQSSRGQEAARKASGWSGENDAAKKSGTSSAKSSQKSAQKNQTAKNSKNAAKTGSAGGTKKKKRMSAADARLLQRMLIIGIAVLAGVCFVIQTVSCANSRISTRQTVMVTLSDNIETTGVAIRNERIITSDRQGVIVGSIENGGKVSKGETVANVYTSTDSARAYMRMAQIEEDLEKFHSMETAGEDSAVEVTALQKSVRRELLDLSGMIFRGDVSGASEGAEDLLYLLNKTQVATRVETDFSDKKNELEKELDSLKKKYPEAPSQLKSPLSGYYISSPDGYENLLNTEICASLTPEKLEEIISVHSVPNNDSVVGKIADDYIWYMACEVSAEDADRLAKDSSGKYLEKNYTLYLAYSEIDSISAKLVGVNTGADSGRRVLIFECSYMVSELSTVRIQPVTIELSSYSGLEVNRNSLTTREVTVEPDDIPQWDMEGRVALAREICPEMFMDPQPEVSESDVSASDVPAFSIEETQEYQAAKLLLQDNDKPVSGIIKDIDAPRSVTYTQQGVFIEWGKEIKFKRIKPIYQTGDKVLCAYNLGSSCIKMYDNVVDDPEEVYDGQIINSVG